MQTLKRTYVDIMQGIGSFGPLARSNASSREDAYTMKRWFASLFAIYETDRMIALDLPWWNVAATKEIEQFLRSRPKARIFEYGSGASTVWLARRSGEICTVEHDSDWLSKFQRQTANFDHVTLMHRSIEKGGREYTGAIHELEGDFDLIVVDGRHRAACLAEAVSRLKRDGIVVFDDSGRSRYRAAIEASGLNETRHFGLSYCVPYPDYTSILSYEAR